MEMSEEMNSISQNLTCTLTQLPLEKRPIPIKWVYKVTNDFMDRPSKYKSKFVIKGLNIMKT